MIKNLLVSNFNANSSKQFPLLAEVNSSRKKSAAAIMNYEAMWLVPVGSETKTIA